MIYGINRFLFFDLVDVDNILAIPLKGHLTEEDKY